jgi:hypothetical protein
VGFDLRTIVFKSNRKTTVRIKIIICQFGFDVIACPRLSLMAQMRVGRDIEFSYVHSLRCSVDFQELCLMQNRTAANETAWAKFVISTAYGALQSFSFL